MIKINIIFVSCIIAMNIFMLDKKGLVLQMVLYKLSRLNCAVRLQRSILSIFSSLRTLNLLYRALVSEV